MVLGVTPRAQRLHHAFKKTGPAVALEGVLYGPHYFHIEIAMLSATRISLMLNTYWMVSVIDALYTGCLLNSLLTEYDNNTQFCPVVWHEIQSICSTRMCTGCPTLTIKQ